MYFFQEDLIMTYEEIVAKVKKEFGSADVSKYEGHLALQINITGEGSGAFYAEINDGQLFIEPFDYKNNDAMLTASGEDIVSILSGKLDAVEAFEAGKLTVDGDISKALSIQPVIEANRKPAKAASAKKKTVSKTASKAEVKEEPVKAAAKAPAKTATKTAAKSTKATVKADSKTAAKAVKTASKTTTKTTKSTAKKG